MANNLRVFNTNSEYQSADLILPAVSYVVETDKVIYDYTPPTPPVFQGKWKATYQDSHVESAQCGSSSEITEGEINKTNLVSVEIGDYCVTSIGSNAFQSCYSLTSVVIPDSVTSIGDYAFYDCKSLTSCTIGSGVTRIDRYVFRYCTSLTSIVIPNSVTSIGQRALSDCSGLTSITVNATTPPTLGSNSAFNGTNNCPIYVPSQSVEAYKTAHNWSDYASRIQPIP